MNLRGFVGGFTLVSVLVLVPLGCIPWPDSEEGAYISISSLDMDRFVGGN